MSNRQAFLYGALGGILPILVSLLTIDIASIIDKNSLTLGNYIGYAIRVLLLIAAGGFVALMNADVRKPLALVQLGVMAPALVTGYINGASAPNGTAVQHAMLQFVSTANAAEVLPQSQIRLAGTFSDVIKGLGTRLDTVNSLNSGTGNFCVTGQGKMPLSGPAARIGNQCSVTTTTGQSSGLVTN